MKAEAMLGIAIIVAMIAIMLIVSGRIKTAKAYGEGYDAGKQEQIKDNIKHGVMDSQGKWLPEFKLAIKKEK